VRHRLGLTTRTQISVYKSQFSFCRHRSVPVRAKTMETSFWSGCQLIYSDSSSLSSTLWLVWCFGFAAMTTTPTLSQFSIGCVYHDGSITRLWSWRSECCMVWLHHTWIRWFVLLTYLVVALAAYVHQLVSGSIPS